MNVEEHDLELGFTLFKNTNKFSHKDQPRHKRNFLLQEEGEIAVGTRFHKDVTNYPFNYVMLEVLRAISALKEVQKKDSNKI